jgi:hypothetical protein
MLRDVRELRKEVREVCEWKEEERYYDLTDKLVEVRTIILERDRPAGEVMEVRSMRAWKHGL